MEADASPADAPPASRRPDVPPAALAAMRGVLHDVAAGTIQAVTVEVPDYRMLDGHSQANLATAVEQALHGFVGVAAQAADPSAPLEPARAAAYALGRGEARRGRTMDGLLAAYRVGARVAWRGLALAASDAGLRADQLVGLAELVFAYIDQLSAASVAGHGDELANEGWVRARNRQRLAHGLLTGADDRDVVTAAERAGWPLPDRLRAVLVPEAALDDVLARLSRRTLHLVEDLPDLPDGVAALVVPHPEPRLGKVLSRAVDPGRAVLGPWRAWSAAATSYRRAVRAWRIPAVAAGQHQGHHAAAVRTGPGLVIDSDDLLAELVASADPDALIELRAKVLAPLAGLRPATAQRLTETLRAWLLHRGRRDAVADELHVHPQTVRYRVGQLRERYGDALDDPRTVLELTIALAIQP